MRQRELKKLKAMLATLTFGQRRDLLEALAEERGAAASVSIIEQAENLRHCPHCDGERTVRNGSASGLQRYKCRDCGRTFNALTGTALARLRQKSKWLMQAEALRDGVTITQSGQASESGQKYGVSLAPPLHGGPENGSGSIACRDRRSGRDLLPAFPQGATSPRSKATAARGAGRQARPIQRASAGTCGSGSCRRHGQLHSCRRLQSPSRGCAQTPASRRYGSVHRRK